MKAPRATWDYSVFVMFFTWCRGLFRARHDTRMHWDCLELDTILQYQGKFSKFFGPSPRKLWLTVYRGLQVPLWDFDARLHIDRYMYDLDSDKGACRLKCLARRTTRPKHRTDDTLFRISYDFQCKSSISAWGHRETQGKAVSLLYESPSGNQVDGLPLVAHNS